jgi:ribosome-associated translation inhibitor RaiA
MRIEIRHRGVKVTDELRNNLEQQLRRALGRFDRHIEFVGVYLRDVNGPRGGVDHRCRIVIELPRRARVIVTGTDADLRTVISEAAGRAEFAVKRHLKRRLARRRPSRRPVRGTPLVAV